MMDKHTIDLTSELKKDGVISIKMNEALDGEKDGSLKIALHIPLFQRGLYYRCNAKYYNSNGCNDWISAANRMQAKEFKNYEGLLEGGLFLTLELSDGLFLTVLPLVGERTMAWLCPEGDELYIKLGNMGKEILQGDLPVLAYSFSDNVYEAYQTVWRTALLHPLIGKSAGFRTERYS